MCEAGQVAKLCALGAHNVIYLFFVHFKRRKGKVLCNE